MSNIGDVSSFSSIQNPYPASAAPDASPVPAGGELGSNEFMTLLVAQLKNQDPLAPIDNTEFISQLATFSSLEKLTSIESILKNLATLDALPESL